MEAKETKNYKNLEKVFDDCCKKGDTLFAIYGYGESDGTVMYIGNEDHITMGLSMIIGKSLSEDADQGCMEISNAILNAIQDVLSKGDLKAIRFGNMLMHCVEKAQEAINNRRAEEDNDEEDGFDPEDEDCKECEDYGKCLLEHLKAIAKKAGIEIRPVAKPKKKQNKK